MSKINFFIKFTNEKRGDLVLKEMAQLKNQRKAKIILRALKLFWVTNITILLWKLLISL